MIIHWEDADWTVDFTDFTLKQAETIERMTGGTLQDFLAAIAEGTGALNAIKVVYWLMLAQNPQHGPAPDPGTVDFKVLAYTAAFTAAAQAEAASHAATEPEPEPGPTSPPDGGPSPMPASPTASPPAASG